MRTPLHRNIHRGCEYATHSGIDTDIQHLQVKMIISERQGLLFNVINERELQPSLFSVIYNRILMATI